MPVIKVTIGGGIHLKFRPDSGASVPETDYGKHPSAQHRSVRKVTDMTEGIIWKQLVLFALPLLAGNLFQQLYNTVDSVVVGNFVGSEALGAVTSNMPAINTLIGLFLGFSTGAGVAISQYFGAKNVDSLRKSVHTAIMATLFFGIFLTFLGIWISPYLVRFMQTPPEVASQAVVYLRIYFSGILGLMFYNMGSGILRAVGDSRRPLYFLIFSSVTNIILDLLFVIKFQMGVAGVAYATILSQFLSSVLVFVVLFKSPEVYHLSLGELRIDPYMLKKIVFIGLPAGIQMALTSFSNVFVQSYINGFGAASTAGWGAYQRIDAFTILPVFSIGLAVTTFVGQNAGARRFDRVRQCVKIALSISIVITVIISVFLFITAPHAIGLFNRDTDVLYYGTIFLRVIGPLDFVVCFNQVLAGTLRGIGDTKAPMLIMLFSFVLFRQIYLFVATHLSASIYVVALGYPLGWLVCSIIMLIYYNRSHWEEKLEREFS